MATPRTAEESEVQMRTAAVERLRTLGVRLSIYRRHPQGIADAIRMLCPQYDRASPPMVIIRAWLGSRPDGAAPAQQIVSTGRPYQMPGSLRAAAERAQCQPRMLSLVSNVPPVRDCERLS